MAVVPDREDSASALSVESEIVKAAAAELRGRRPLRHARVREAAEALSDNRPADAERLLAGYLEQRPNDASAMLVLAEALLKLGLKGRAETLLERCVRAAPDYQAGRFVYASTLYQCNKLGASLAQLEQLLAGDPHNILCLDMKAAVLVAMGRHRDSLDCRRQLAERHPNSPELLVKYAKALRNVGEREATVDILRRALALDPSCGIAWWTLADLKTWRFSVAEIAAMERALARAEKDGRMYLNFALGKAFADRGNCARSFDHYARANALKRLTITYDPDWLSRQIAASKALFTREFFAARAGEGCSSSAPIFIVGMQRAGSTLIEQILASHSAIEATAELPDITLMVERLCETAARAGAAGYPDVLATLDGATLRKLGDDYLETTGFRRPLGRPFFLDKNPYNYLHVGLIHLVLPNARIIDVRRHPLACCWSNFAAHFEMGALFAYRFNELGRAYADYVELMAHFDSVLPGRVHRVVYENLIRDPEREIRELLERLGLPFEDACLAFHANARPMDSVSSEQVRRPIYRDALEQWRNYDAWLGPLKSALGPALDGWTEP